MFKPLLMIKCITWKSLLSVKLLFYSRTPRKRTPLGPPRSVRLRGVSANGGLKFQKELKGQEQ